jgi:hypothetical protein
MPPGAALVAAPGPAPRPVAPCASFAGLSLEETVAMARRHLGPLGATDIHFAPQIPADKERNVRRIHGGHLPPEEPIAVLYDSTLFGSAEEGVVLTARRLCWKNSFFNPQALPWRSVELTSLQRSKADVMVLGGAVGCLNEEVARAMLALLTELAGEAQRRMPPVASASASHADGMIELVRRHLGVRDELFVAPAIPEKKERNVRKLHRIGPEERVLTLYDNTVFGSAEEGFVLTDQRFCWKESFEDPCSTPWGQLSAGQVALRDAAEGFLEVQGRPLRLIGVHRDELSVGLVALLHAMSEGRTLYR